jgi:hypothetical protein
MSFEFDGIFQPDSHQKVVYSEMEELVLGVMDGYNMCIMAYRQTGSGKTHSLLGDVRFVLNDDDNEFDDVNVEISNEGIQLQSVKQLFTVSEHRSERYDDVFSFTVVEVHDERLVDLVAGTNMGELQGRVDFDDNASRRSAKSRKRIVSEDEASSFFQPSNSSASKGNKTKLEIRTNHDGNTAVQGLVSIPVNHRRRRRCCECQDNRNERVLAEALSRLCLGRNRKETLFQSCLGYLGRDAQPKKSSRRLLAQVAVGR